MRTATIPTATRRAATTIRFPAVPTAALRITGAPRYARVFADGYYVGIVNDFDGIFQHLNLEAGPHHIEIENEGYGAIGFDVYIRPGQTIAYRARVLIWLLTGESSTRRC